ncbi:uncharacterized protein [Montipora capricornis]|uniref:uncharacterized protein n=1 Tax=Montipora capricornis TaxID=246305 RepID=UPI0035F12E31
MNDLVEEGKAKAAGIISIFIGVCTLIELICGFIYLSLGGPDGSGLWCGVGLLVITILGIVTWAKRNKAVLVFYLVMCILWVIVCIVQVIIAFFAWVIWRVIRAVVEEQCYQVGDSCYCDADEAQPIPVHNCSDIKTIESLFLAIMIMSVFATILTLAGSIIGCMGTCCARPEPAGMVVVQQPGYPVVGVTNTQHVYPGPGQAYPGQQPVGAYPAAAPPPDYGLPQKM